MKISKRTLSIGLLVAGCALVFFLFVSSDHEIMNSPVGPGPIVAFGDSLTEGFGAEKGQSYPDHLSKILGRPILNRGVSGETTGEAHKRFERDVLAEEPDLVLVCLGGNDLLRRIDADVTFGTLREIVVRCQDIGAMVVIIGVEGLPLISADFDSRYAQLAEETGALYVPDILDGIMGDDSLMADPLHPNGEGYARIAKRIAGELKPHLSE